MEHLKTPVAKDDGETHFKTLGDLQAATEKDDSATCFAILNDWMHTYYDPKNAKRNEARSCLLACMDELDTLGFDVSAVIQNWAKKIAEYKPEEALQVPFINLRANDAPQGRAKATRMLMDTNKTLRGPLKKANTFEVRFVLWDDFVAFIN